MSEDKATTDSSKAAPVSVGDVVANKYRVDGVLGRGGMGVVVSATDLELERKVAIKFVERTDEQATARFLREARAAARMDSQHVTRVFEVGRLEQGLPYIVMEQLHGESFATLLKHGPLPVADAASYLLQICDALAQAHGRKLVHRDLKPDNLFLHTRSDGSRIVKVLDFGVSKALEGTALTESKAIVGSPPYLAPEQIEHPDRVDARTDLWALGVVLYELVSGERPFRGATMVELCMNILLAEPPPLAEKVPELPPGVADVVKRCLEKAMDARYASVLELGEALEPFADAESGPILSAIRRALDHEPLSRSVKPVPERRDRPSEPRPGGGAARNPSSDTVKSGFERGGAPVLGKRGAWLIAAAAVVFLGLGVLAARGLPPTSAAAPTATASPSAPATELTSAAAVTEPKPATAPAANAAPSAPAPIAAERRAPEPLPLARELAASAKPVIRAAARPKPLASAEPTPAPSPSAPAAAPSAPSCRVLEVVENGRVMQASASQRVTFEWARRLCASRPRAGAGPYRLSEAGIVVKCACE